MSTASAGRVSRGGRRKGTAPPGNDIMRKNTASRALADSTLRIHDGNSPSAERVPPSASTKAPGVSQRARVCAELGKYFNLHLLRSNVVGNVLGSDCQLVVAGNRLLWDAEFARIGASPRVPSEFNRSRGCQS